MPLPSGLFSIHHQISLMQTLKTGCTWMPQTTQKNKLDIPWSTIFLFTLHNLWLARNNLVFSNTPLINPKSVSKSCIRQSYWILDQLWYWEPALTPANHHSSNNSNTNSCFSSWQPPPPYWIKLNCGGSITKSRMGIGGCLRDATGTWLKGFSKNIGEGNVLKTEL